MLTKYTITIGATEYDVPDECLANWDEISFSLRRTDYSGVVRSYSTEFVFVGTIRDLLWNEYVAYGFKASASIAVNTLTDTHEWEERFSAPLDFSSMEMEHGKMTINAIDNTLAALLKSKKSQKYEFPMAGFPTDLVELQRIELKNDAQYYFLNNSQPFGVVDIRYNENKSQVISTEFLEPTHESRGGDVAANRFFMKVNRGGASMQIVVHGTVRCLLSPLKYSMSATASVPVAKMQFGWDDGQGNFVFWADLFDDDLLHQRINGTLYDMWIGGSQHKNYAALNQLIADAPSGLYNGMFGVVGPYSWGSSDYWNGNEVYEYRYGKWLNKGLANNYYQDRVVDASGSMGPSQLVEGNYPMLRTTAAINFMYGVMEASWSDPVRNTLNVRTLSPLQLISRVVDAISPGATVAIANDSGGLLENTRLVPAEELRRLPDAKVYTTFSDFAGWLETVFGYTYRIVGNEVQFVHRSAVFVSSPIKEIQAKSIKMSVNDNLLYASVKAGYSKKDYGEIDGRLETNFTNYYETGFACTDHELSLISKYRADGYGVEFVARKGEKDITDDKSDGDIFVLHIEPDGFGVNHWAQPNNGVYSPSECVRHNGQFISAMGSGMAVTLKMTSSDGNDALADVLVGNALFSAIEADFSTDDMSEPVNLDSMLRVTDGTLLCFGFIKEAKARFSKLNGMDYTIIVKSITKL